MREHAIILWFQIQLFVMLLLLLLSHFSHVRPCATPWTAAHQAPHPWDSPGKNTGVGCHFLLQCMKVKSESEVAQSCPTQRPHGLQPTRLLHPWHFPGKSTGNCHCLLQAICNSSKKKKFKLLAIPTSSEMYSLINTFKYLKQYRCQKMYV